MLNDSERRNIFSTSSQVSIKRWRPRLRFLSTHEYEDQVSPVADCSCDTSDETFRKLDLDLLHMQYIYIEGKSPQETFGKATGQTFEINEMYVNSAAVTWNQM